MDTISEGRQISPLIERQNPETSLQQSLSEVNSFFSGNRNPDLPFPTTHLLSAMININELIGESPAGIKQLMEWGNQILAVQEGRAAGMDADAQILNEQITELSQIRNEQNCVSYGRKHGSFYSDMGHYGIIRPTWNATLQRPELSYRVLVDNPKTQKVAGIFQDAKIVPQAK